MRREQRTKNDKPHIDSITCSERKQHTQEEIEEDPNKHQYNNREVFDCSIQMSNGQNRVVETSELNIDGDIEIIDNPNVGERHIDPNEALLPVEKQGTLHIKSEDQHVREETGLDIQRK